MSLLALSIFILFWGFRFPCFGFLFDFISICSFAFLVSGRDRLFCVRAGGLCFRGLANLVSMDLGGLFSLVFCVLDLHLKFEHFLIVIFEFFYEYWAALVASKLYSLQSISSSYQFQTDCSDPHSSSYFYTNPTPYSNSEICYSFCLIILVGRLFLIFSIQPAHVIDFR